MDTGTGLTAVTEGAAGCRTVSKYSSKEDAADRYRNGEGDWRLEGELGGELV